MAPHPPPNLGYWGAVVSATCITIPRTSVNIYTLNANARAPRLFDAHAVSEIAGRGRHARGRAQPHARVSAEAPGAHADNADPYNPQGPQQHKGPCGGNGKCETSSTKGVPGRIPHPTWLLVNLEVAQAMRTVHAWAPVNPPR